ncbi:MAG: ABC transporter permease [Bacteroidota bacterium]|nr:ABC transporter permease [Bacteroidota bacterium]
MFRNYLKTSWRNIVRGRVYSLLNILGLATGMAVALLIGLWVSDQVSYDRFFPGYEQAYQVRYKFSDDGVIRNTEMVSIPLAAVLKQDIPEIAHVALMGPGPWQQTVRVGEKQVSLAGMTVGEEFLQVFPFPVIEGDVATALRESGSVVLTQSAARAIFGTAEPVGKLIEGLGKVTAVIRDIPENSSFHFQFLTLFQPMASDEWIRAAATNWNHNFFTLYASLKPGSTHAQVEPRIRMLVKKYAPATYTTFHQEPMLQPWKDRHLYTEFRDGAFAGGLVDYVRLFSIVGALVLLIACINFMNLSTARSEKRAREVGVRKVMGSGRGGLIVQFLAEAVILTSLAFLLAVVLLQLVLPGFNALAGTGIRIAYSNGYFWLIMLSYVLFTGLLAGSRPAFYLSGFHPAKVLKGAMVVGHAAGWLRKVLVVAQFTCSIGLIIGTMIVYQQIEYGRRRPIGYDPNRLIMAPGVFGLTFRQFPISRYRAYRLEVLRSGVVSGMTQSLTAATDIGSHNTIDNWPGRMANEPLSLAMNAVADSGYFTTLGMCLVAGRNFSDNLAADTTNAILNEAAVRRMRLKEPVNAVISWSMANAPNRLRVIGVVKDALVNNPFAQPEPMIFVYQPGWTGTATYRLAPAVSTSVAIAKLRTIYKQYHSDGSFDYQFVDNRYATGFALELLIGQLAGIFAALTIFISCLGLFGLAAYMAEQRTKEIGIRKVLGASAGQLVALLGREFILLVLLSCLIASPIAWCFLHRWLQGYYYRTTIGPGVFVMAAAMAVLITALTVGYQSVRAALMNPVNSLRSE